MQLNLRNLAPVLVATMAALAGCKTAPTQSPETAVPAASSPATETPPPNPASILPLASPVEFYVAQAQPSKGSMAVKLPNGDMVYLLGEPVLTRDDLTEAAALADRQGQNFVGLRFTKVGARKLNEVSSKNIDHMLALVVDQELVAAPRIAEPLNRGVLAFAVPSAQIAMTLAAKIRGDDQATPPSPGPVRTPKPSKQPTPVNRKAPANR